MADLRIRGFSDDLLDEAKSEASLDGDTLKALVVAAVEREVARRQAVPLTERRERAAARRAEDRAERARLRAEAAE